MTKVNTQILREFRARKAKCGFACTCYTVQSMRGIAKVLDIIDSRFSPNDYSAEITGMQRDDFRLYTDNDAVADFIRREFITSLDKAGTKPVA